jgi:UrcA family protein
MNPILVAAFAATLLVVPGQAQAQTPVASAVSFADLDLARASDVARLDRRIAIAVRAACGDPAAYDLKGRKAVRRCQAATQEAALPQRDAAIAVARRSYAAAR